MAYMDVYTSQCVVIRAVKMGWPHPTQPNPNGLEG